MSSANGKIELYPGVEGVQGIYAAEPGYARTNWLSRKAVLRINAQHLRAPAEIRFILSCSDASYYTVFPLSVLLAIDGKPAGKCTFSRSAELLQVSLQSTSRSTDLLLEIVAESSFIPAQLGINADSRELAVMLHDLRVLPSAAGEKAKAAQLPARSSTANAPGYKHTARLTWMSNLLNMSGYAMAARNLAKGLAASGCSFDLVSLCAATQGCIDLNTLQLLIPLIKQAPAADSLLVLQGLPALLNGTDVAAYMRSRYPGMRKYIICTMFETDRIPESWVAPGNSLDEIWVPTQFNRETFHRSGIAANKLRVVPFLGFDPAHYAGANGKVTFPGSKRFNFLSVFEWTKRKGWDILVRAFTEEFKPEEDVALNMYTYRGLGTSGQASCQTLALQYLTQQLGKRLEELPLVNVLEGMGLPDNAMPNLYAGADAFVLPSRGEGWGMPYVEAMAAGLPAIGTNWGGNTEFMNDSNSFPLPIDGLRPVDEDQVRDNHFYRGHQWAEPSVSQLREIMRFVFQNHQAAMEKGRQAKADVFSKWTIHHAAQRVGTAVEEASH